MKGTRLTIDLFRIFRDLADTRSFSKTASQNFLTQSAVSQQLSFLERHFGKRFIDRGKGRFSLTEPGAHFLESCRKILSVYEETLDHIRDENEPTGAVTVQTVYSIGLHHLNLYVKTFMRRFPKVNLKVEYNRSDRIYTDILQGRCDLGIVAYPKEQPNLKILPFHKEKLVLICATEDPLSTKARVRLTLLKGHSFVAFNPSVPTRRAIDDVLRKHNITVNIVQEFDNIETLKRSVELGTGVSIVP